MASLIEENPDATHFLFIAASGQGGLNKDQSAYAWWVMTPNAMPLPGGSGNNTIGAPVGGWLQETLFVGTLEALTATFDNMPVIPTDSSLHIVSRHSPYRDVLKGRRGAVFMKADGKPPAHNDKLEEIGKILQDRNILTSTGEPCTKLAIAIFSRLDLFAKEQQKNIDNDERSLEAEE